MPKKKITIITGAAHKGKTGSGRRAFQSSTYQGDLTVSFGRLYLLSTSKEWKGPLVIQKHYYYFYSFPHQEVNYRIGYRTCKQNVTRTNFLKCASLPQLCLLPMSSFRWAWPQCSTGHRPVGPTLPLLSLPADTCKVIVYLFSFPFLYITVE